MRLKSHETPRKQGRNIKSRAASARLRQLKKRTKTLLKRFIMFHLFPSLVHEIPVYKYEKNRDNVIDYVYTMKEKIIQMERYRTNRGGWQSNDGYYLEENPVRDIVLNSLGHYFNSNKVYYKSNVNLYLTACWFNINNKDHFNVQHDHPGCHMSGVLYLKIPEVFQKNFLVLMLWMDMLIL